MKSRIVSVVVLLLSGCATTDTYWVKDDHWTPKEVRVERVDSVPWEGVQGWTLKDKKTGVCHIYIRRSAQNQECIEAHERKHCDGWDHPHYPSSLACVIQPTLARF